MKTIAKVMLLVISTFLISQCERMSEDEPDPNDLVNIPDEKFLHALIALGVDTNKDGFISYVEAEAITYLTVRRLYISDMTGIEAFTNLRHLGCYGNYLSSLDVSSNIALESLDCSSNKLTSLDVFNNTALTDLGCAGCKLTSLDVSNNTALTELGCGGNQLTNLDVSMNIELHHIELSYMPTLNAVCVWKLPFPPDGVWIQTWLSPNVYFTTDCSQ